MRYALPMLTVILGFGTYLVFPDPSMAVIAALLPSSFVLGYFFEKSEKAEANKKSKKDESDEPEKPEKQSVL